MRKVSKHKNFESVEKSSNGSKMELDGWDYELYGWNYQSYLWQQEFLLDDLGVSFHCNDTSNFRASVVSLSKEGKDKVSFHNDRDGKYNSGFDSPGV